MSQFQFTSQPQNQQSIQVNAPIQFSQQQQFTNIKQQQTTKYSIERHRIIASTSQERQIKAKERVVFVGKNSKRTRSKERSRR